VTARNSIGGRDEVISRSWYYIRDGELFVDNAAGALL
jgi:hypothetical protein